MKIASDKKFPLRSKVYGRITAKPPRTVWTVGDFEDFGTREGVHKVLQRLAKDGLVRRIAPGFYDRPRINKLTGKPTAPDYRAVIDAITRRNHTRMLVDGMTAANDLGLSDAVSGRIVVHSDARIKPVRLSNQTIVFRPTSATKLYWAGRPAMRIVQALYWLKPKLDDPDEKRRVERKLLPLVKNPELHDDLEAGFASLPLWMQAFIRSLVPVRPRTVSPGQRTAPARRKATVS